MSKRKAITLDTQQDEEDHFSDEDDAWCSNMPLPCYDACSEDSLTNWDEAWNSEGEDAWCRDIQLPSPKRRCVEEADITHDSSPEEQTGGALFEFNLTEGSLPRRWKNIVNKTRFTSQLIQRREATPNDHVGQELVEALRQSLLRIITPDKGLRDKDKVHFTMQATAFGSSTNHCFQSTQFDISELRQSTERFTDYMNQLARQLNSSQSFSPGDAFELAVTTIRMPGEGSKRKKYGFIKARVRGIHKRCRVVIRNPNNDMCCALALVTMRAYADEKAGVFPPVAYDTLKRGTPTHERVARELLTAAGVSEGPCGQKELVQFQAVLHQYQIKVLRVGRPHMITYSGPSRPRKLLLIMEDNHYDGCTSYAAIFNTSYYCYLCDKGYEHEEYRRHPCNGRRCPSCFMFECEDYINLRNALPSDQTHVPKPTHRCAKCNRHFYGQDCLKRHAAPSKNNASLCKTRKKCVSCSKVYEREVDATGKYRERPHQCGYGECQHCSK